MDLRTESPTDGREIHYVDRIQPRHRTPHASTIALAILWCVCGWTAAASAQERLGEHEFALSSGRLVDPSGIWSDGTTMWVGDRSRGRLFAYDLATKEEVAGELFETVRPVDLWSDGTMMWVLTVEESVIAYDLTTRSRVPTSDFNVVDDPRGMWSDGTTMWVVSDSRAPHMLYAYDLATTMRAPDKDFELQDISSRVLYDIMSDGTTMWVLGCRYGNECSPYNLHAYDLATKARTPDRDFEIQPLGWPRARPRGIWTDGATMWFLPCPVIGARCHHGTAYAYDMVTKARAPEKDLPGLIQQVADNPGGFWSDGATLWVAGTPYDGVLYAYDMATKVRTPDKDIDTPRTVGNTSPVGIWSDGRTMWVVNYRDSQVYAYDMATKARKPNEEFAIRGGGGSGLWSDGSTIWTSATENSVRVLQAYDMATKERRPGQDFDTLDAAGNYSAIGIWSDGSTMWTADRRDRKLYAYDMATKGRVPDRDFDVPELTGWSRPPAGWLGPNGIWSDGSTMWVPSVNDSDPGGRSNLVAYDMVTKARTPDRDIFTYAADGVRRPGSVWSDGSTMWVVDTFVARLYAYDVATAARAPNRDFDTLRAAGNSHPNGIWSDGSTMWVTDGRDATLYAYDMATKAHTPDRDFDAAGRSIWSNGSTLWVAGGADVRAYDMATKEHTPDGDIDLRAAGLISARDIWSDGATMWFGGSERFQSAFTRQTLYAYGVATRQHLPTKNFNTQEREDLTGFWSDGQRMWVVYDRGDVHVYSWPFTSACPQCPRFPDLIVRLQDVPVSDDTPIAGQSVTLRVVVRNQGSVTADATSIRAYRSVDLLISRSDAEVGSNRVASLAPDAAAIQALVLTTPSTSGTYYFGACVDGVSGERNTANNCSAGVAVTVSGGVSFTDDPLEAGVTVVKAVHFNELRARIGELRTSHGLGPWRWTDEPLTAGTTPVRAVHVSELREALRQAFDAAGQAFGFSTEPAQAGGAIRAEHVNELRRAVRALENRR